MILASDKCPLTKFEGGLNLLHEADDGVAQSYMDGIYGDCSSHKINK